MSKPSPAEPVKLIFSVLARDVSSLNDAVELLCRSYGVADFISEMKPFDYTDYYRDEMGDNISRRFLGMEKLIPPEMLPDIKRAANAIEDRFSCDSRRRVNIDPGYISKTNLILATGKNFTHRIYLRDGIYADLTLIYQGKRFRELPWTYPDYAAEKQKQMMGKIREKYLLQLRMAKSQA
ncbi:MAG TPA: DUF4416 family protein [Smithella sp.]|nr:DUF4416 family protein [Smithella sp.]